MEKLGLTAIRNDGLRFNYQNGDWGLIELEGLDFAPIDINSVPRGFGNGDIVVGKRKASRDIKIVARLQNGENYQKLRSQVIGFHNSNYKFDLLINYLGDIKIAKNCELKVAGYPTGNIWKNQNLSLMFFCPDSDLLAEKSDIVGFTTVKPLWGVPRGYTSTQKLAFGEIAKATEKTVNYLGSENAPITATIRASGLVQGVDLTINLLTSHISTTLVGGDTLVIDTEKRVVTKNTVPVPLTEYDANSLLEMVLVYGDNTVKIESTSNAFNADIDFIGRYGGI